MKVTYTQNRFEIDEVPVINPEVLPVISWNRAARTVLLHNGVIIEDLYEFDLPDNIIAEKVKQCLTANVNLSLLWIDVLPSTAHLYEVCDKVREVYRLKLKEPLVDTGSKLTYDKIKEVKDALGEPGIGALRIVENQFLPDDMVIVSSKMYKALKANP